MVENELDAVAPNKKKVIIHSRELGSWDGIHQALPASEGFVLVDCTGSPLDAVHLAEGMAPCVLVMDCEALDELDPSDFREKVAFGESVRVLPYGAATTAGLDRTVRYLELGCLGLLSEKLLLRKAVQAVSAGEVWAPRKHIAGLLRRSLTQLHSPMLTPREAEILRMITGGLKNAEIAENLGVARETVRWHIRGLYSKIGVENRLGAVTFGSRLFADDQSVVQGSEPFQRTAQPVSKPPSRAAGDLRQATAT